MPLILSGYPYTEALGPGLRLTLVSWIFQLHWGKGGPFRGQPLTLCQGISWVLVFQATLGESRLYKGQPAWEELCGHSPFTSVLKL